MILLEQSNWFYILIGGGGVGAVALIIGETLKWIRFKRQDI